MGWAAVVATQPDQLLCRQKTELKDSLGILVKFYFIFFKKGVGLEKWFSGYEHCASRESGFNPRSCFVSFFFF